MKDVTLTNMVMVQDPATGKVLVQRRVRRYCGLAFPGGHAEDGESIYDSAVREVKEETGYDIRNLRPCGFIYWDHENGSKYFTYFFRTTEFSGELLPETDEGPVRWMELSELTGAGLAPNMDKYLKMMTGEYSECYCRGEGDGGEGHWEVTYYKK